MKAKRKQSPKVADSAPREIAALDARRKTNAFRATNALSREEADERNLVVNEERIIFNHIYKSYFERRLVLRYRLDFEGIDSGPSGKSPATKYGFVSEFPPKRKNRSPPQRTQARGERSGLKVRTMSRIKLDPLTVRNMKHNPKEPLRKSMPLFDPIETLETRVNLTKAVYSAQAVRNFKVDSLHHSHYHHRTQEGTTVTKLSPVVPGLRVLYVQELHGREEIGLQEAQWRMYWFDQELINRQALIKDARFLAAVYSATSPRRSVSPRKEPTGSAFMSLRRQLAFERNLEVLENKETSARQVLAEEERKGRRRIGKKYDALHGVQFVVEKEDYRRAHLLAEEISAFYRLLLLELDRREAAVLYASIASPEALIRKAIFSDFLSSATQTPFVEDEDRKKKKPKAANDAISKAEAAQVMQQQWRRNAAREEIASRRSRSAPHSEPFAFPEQLAKALQHQARKRQAVEEVARKRANSVSKAADAKQDAAFSFQQHVRRKLAREAVEHRRVTTAPHGPRQGAAILTLQQHVRKMKALEDISSRIQECTDPTARPSSELRREKQVEERRKLGESLRIGRKSTADRENDEDVDLELEMRPNSRGSVSSQSTQQSPVAASVLQAHLRRMMARNAVSERRRSSVTIGPDSPRQADNGPRANSAGSRRDATRVMQESARRRAAKQEVAQKRRRSVQLVE